MDTHVVVKSNHACMCLPGLINIFWKHDYRLEPVMLKNLPIIPSQIFTHYTFLIPIAIPIIPFLFYCVNDNITIQE